MTLPNLPWARALSGATVLVVSLVACSGAEPELTAFPPPTGDEVVVVPPGHEEERLGSRRKQWIQRMHRAAPDVDWRAIERENGARAQERRNAAVRAAGSSQILKATSPWSEVGSSNQAGRMHCVSISSDKTKLYAGSDRGGVWRGSLTGAGWTPLADNLYGGENEVLTVPSTTPGAPEILFVFRDDGFVRVSVDDGATWTTPTGLGGLNAIRGVARLADAANTIVFLGRLGSVGVKTAIFASNNGGVSFSKRWTSNASWASSLWVPRTGVAAANTLYVVHQGALQRSTDGGFTFAPLATIDAGASEAILTGSEAGGTILYAAMNNGGTWTLHRSTAGGASFTPKSTLTDFWGPLCASILNQDLVCYGGVEARRSLNGGASFSLINTWQAYYNAPSTKLHADLWGIYCFPDPVNAAQERWYFATDGGLYHSTTQTITVSNLSLSGLGVSQYYATHTSAVNPNTIQAGAQDQGYQRGTYVTPTGSGPSTPFVQMISGDYGHLTSGNGAHGVVYSVYPGFLMVVTGETNSVVADMADFPAGANYEWLPPLAADPLNVNQCMFGANQLWRYVKSGNSWSPQLHSTFNFATGGGSYLTMMAFAPTDPQRMYATNDGGRLFWSTDHGVNWTQSASIAPGEHYFYGNALAVHPTNALEAVVGGSGYSNPGVYRTTNGGQTWTPLLSGLPQTHVYDLAYDAKGDVYAATETGAWRWVRGSGQWVDVLGGVAPITTYWSVEHVPGKNVMRFGTYGRGIWDYAIPACSGSAVTLGTGCPGSGGFVPALALGGCPSPGYDVTLSITGALGNSTGVFVFGLGTQSLALGSGCFLHAAPLLPISLSLPLAGSGAGNGSLVVPTSLPLSIGTGQFAMQVLVLDPGVAAGFCVSNALTVTIQ